MNYFRCLRWQQFIIWGLHLFHKNSWKKNCAQADLIIASEIKLKGSRAYYFVYAEQQQTPLIAKFVEWLLTEVERSKSAFLK